MAEIPHPLDAEIGARIRIRRKCLSMTQSQLAAELGVTFQQLQKYEKGVNRVSGSTLVRLARALDTSVAALVGEAAREPSTPGIYEKLSAPGAIELLEAYADVPDYEARQAVVALVKALASATQKTSRAA